MSWNHDPRPLRDEEYPEPDPNDDDYDTYVCPECGAAVFEDADQCPNCLTYISPPTGPWLGRSIIWIGLGLLGASVIATLLSFA